MSGPLVPRALGHRGLSGTAVGMGCSRLGAFWQQRSPAAGTAAVEAALDGGVTLFDVADCYSRGIAERIVGRATVGRPEVTVVTKVGLLKTPAALRLARRTGQVDGSVLGARAGGRAPRSYAPGYLREAVQLCLRRQARGVLDVVLLHEPDAEVLRRGEFLSVLDELLAQGVIRDWGVSAADTAAVDAALDLPGLGWLELPAGPPASAELVALSADPRAAAVATVGLAVLGEGDLLGDTGPGTPSAQGHAGRVAELVERALSQPGLDCVLVGMSSAPHVRDNLAQLGARAAP